MKLLDFDNVSETFHQFVRDLSAYSVANVVPAVFGLAAVMIFTRVFSPDAFGRYSIAMALAGVGSTLLYGWLDQSILRFGPEYDERDLIGTVFVALLGISAVVIALSIAGYTLFGDLLDQYRPFYFAAIALLIAQGLFQPLVVLFQATLKSKLVTVFKTVNAVCKLGLAVLLAIVVFDHIVGWIWASTLAILLTIAFMAVKSDAVRTFPRVQRDILVRISGYGIPLIGWVVGDPLLNQADRILIEVLRSSAAVGIYASNYSLVDWGLRLALIPLLNAIQPIVINSWSGDNRREVENLIQRFTRYFLILGVPPLILTGALSRPLSTLLLGSQYHQGYVVIPIVACGVFLWSISNLGQIGLVLQERTGLMSIGLLVAVVFNVVVDIPLISVFGYLGAAVGTVLSYGVYAAFVLLVSRRQIRWKLPVRTIRNVAFAGAVMAVLPAMLYSFKMYTLTRAIAVAVVSFPIYLVVLYVINEISREDVNELRGMM